MGLAWSNDPESYAGSSIATGRASHARQVKGDNPDKKGYPSPLGWGLGVWLTTSHHKKKPLPPRILTQLKPDDHIYDNVGSQIRIILRKSK